MKILWLASWYPSKHDTLTGDFVQRHAQAAALHHDVHVLHVKRDDAIGASIDKSINTKGRLSETVVLYKPALHFIKGISSIFSAIAWYGLMKKETRQWIEQNGKPDIIHVQAAWKAGLIALWCKKTYGVPYFVSEHYTGYLKEAKGFVPTFNAVQHYFLKKIFHGADKVLPVSNYLGKALQEKYGVGYEVMENVINTSIFIPPVVGKQANAVFTLLYVSLLNLQKNPAILFGACGILVKRNFNFQLQLVAPANIAQQYLDANPAIKPFVKLLPETSQEELAKLMQQADLFVFPSLFESFGLVPYEAIACGTPVIVSDIEVFRNKLDALPFVSFCSIHNPTSLADKIMELAIANIQPDRQAMHQFVEASFSGEVIAQHFQKLYTKA